LQRKVPPVPVKYIATIPIPTVANSVANGAISIQMAVTANATGAALTPGPIAVPISDATNRDPWLMGSLLPPDESGPRQKIGLSSQEKQLLFRYGGNRMKKVILFTALIALIVTTLPSHAETKEKCESKCIDQCGSYNKSDKDFNNCMRVCMAECLPGKSTSSRNLLEPSQSALESSKPCADAETRETGRTTNLMLAAEKDLPCYAGGKYVGNCPRNQPYYNVFGDACYATIGDCKKADGDLSSVQGSGGCVRCGK
jgi:hypothetical protein